MSSPPPGGSGGPSHSPKGKGTQEYEALFGKVFPTIQARFPGLTGRVLYDQALSIYTSSKRAHLHFYDDTGA
eukprot:10016438-Alexandrium_andersonii.AAC.1